MNPYPWKGYENFLFLFLFWMYVHPRNNKTDAFNKLQCLHCRPLSGYGDKGNTWNSRQALLIVQMMVLGKFSPPHILCLRGKYFSGALSRPTQLIWVTATRKYFIVTCVCRNCNIDLNTYLPPIGIMLGRKAHCVCANPTNHSIPPAD